MKLNDAIHLSLFYRKKKGLTNYTANEVISIGYDAFVQANCLYNHDHGSKKTSFFIQLLEWRFMEEFRAKSLIKIPRNQWYNGIRISTVMIDKPKLEVSRKVEHKSFFDDFDLLEDAYNRLSYRDKMIILHRYGLKGHTKMTLKEIGKILELSTERVRVLHLDALKQLKKELLRQTCEK